MSPQEVLGVLEYYKYFVIFPIAIVEGPIIAIISGFLVSLGFLSGPLTYVVLITADMIGDSLYYTIGKYFKSSVWAKKYAGFLGFNEQSEVFLEEHFKKHKAKTFILAKISHGLGGSVQIASGIAGVRYRDFIFWSFIGTTPKALILLILGFYVGKSYVKIDGYFDFIAILTIIIVFTLFLSYILINKYTKNFLVEK